MSYTIKPLKKISNKEFLNDVKKYIKNTHEFYKEKVPELNVLANRLRKEYTLQEFYKIFDKLWNSWSNNERSLAIHTLQLYNREFDINTWYFLKEKIIHIKSFDEVNSIGEIISDILYKIPDLKREIIALSRNKNVWLKRISTSVCFYGLKKKKIKDPSFLLFIIAQNIKDKDKNFQKEVGYLLCETAKLKKYLARKFILKHNHMPEVIFTEATKNMKELRKLRKIKKLK